MSNTPDLWEVRELGGGLVLELMARDNPALVLTQGENRVRVKLVHVKGLVAALVDAATDLAEVLALGGKAAWPTPDLDMPKRKERNDGRRGAYQAVSSR